MEILIVGIAVVILMAYVSTRIKKSAASAFGRENIDTPEFSLVKPEGFLNPVDYTEKTPFEAYTREVGERAAGRARRHARTSAAADARKVGAVLEKRYGFRTNPASGGLVLDLAAEPVFPW